MPLQWDTLRALKEMYKQEELRQFLLLYYATATGHKELENSPHRDRPVEEFVESLIEEST